MFSKQSLRRLFAVVMAGAFSLVVPSASPAQVMYDKTFYVTGVETAPAAKIHGGALVETWYSTQMDGKDLIDENYILNQDANADNVVKVKFKRAKRQAVSKGINLPANPDPRTVLVRDSTKNVLQGWMPEKAEIKNDGHSKTNSADAEIKVEAWNRGPLAVKKRTGGGNVEAAQLGNYVKATIKGKALAQPPDDGDALHSADSYGAVGISSKTKFRAQGANPPVIEEIQGSFRMRGGSFLGAPKFGDVLDPYYLSVTDLETGEVTTKQIMSLRLGFEDAVYVVDDAGIRFTINRNNPKSFIDLNFSSAESSWVLNPYTYHVRLDSANGLQTSGAYLTSNWTTTMDADRLTVSYSFGMDGMPLDSARVRPQLNLVTGRDYAYDVGAGGGAGVFATAVPEPSSLALFGASMVCLVGYRCHRRKRR